MAPNPPIGLKPAFQPRQAAPLLGQTPYASNSPPRPFNQGQRILTWILLFVMVFILDLSLRKREFTDKSIDFQVVLKLAVWGVCSLWAAFNWKRFRGVLANWTTAPWLLLLAVFALSAAWSTSPMLTLIDTVTLVVVFAYTVFALATLGEDESVHCIVWSCAIFMLISIVLYFVDPSFARGEAWSVDNQVITNRLSGITAQPNVIGHMAGMATLLTIAYFKPLGQRNKWFRYGFIGLGLITLVLSGSRTTMAALAFALLCFWLFRRNTRWTLPLLLIAVVGFLMYAVPNTDDLARSVSRSGNSQEVLTATNRTHVWKLAWWMIGQKPFQGWGYGTLADNMGEYAARVVPELNKYKPPHAHNVYLQIMVSAGVLTLPLFLIAIFVNIRALAARKALAAGSLLAFWMIVSMTEAVGFTGIAILASLNMFLPVGIAALGRAPSPVRRRKSGGRAKPSRPRGLQVQDMQTRRPSVG